MELNRIQVKIFEKLGKDNSLETDEYIKKFSVAFINVQRNGLEALSEKEGDLWIHKAYLQSLSS